MIDNFWKFRLSVPYDHVLMPSHLTNSATNHFDSLGAVCPQSLKNGIFTTSALDNISYDPTSTSAQMSFHGTSI